MLEKITDAPWEFDDTVVLQNKWQVANERAIECEKLSQEFSLLLIKYQSRKLQKLDAVERTARSVEEITTIASKGLYPTGLLSRDFQWFIDQQPENLNELLKSKCEETSSMPTVPDVLWKQYTKQSKEKTQEIMSERWSKLLPLFKKMADCLASFSRRFADALQHSLNQLSTTSASENQSCEELPESPDEWEEAAKKVITHHNREIKFSGEPRLLLTCLILSYPNKVTAGDLANALGLEGTAKIIGNKISDKCNKLEKAIKKRLEIDYGSEDPRWTDRPIQRQKDNSRRTLYGLNPKLANALRR